MSVHPLAVERRAPAPALVDAALAPSRQSVFWLDDVPDRPAFPPLRGVLEADLAIVGGGFAGLWTAVLAHRRDPEARIVLLEGQRVGWAASGRNGGFAEASLTHGEQNGRSRWPQEYDELARLGAQNLDELVKDVAELGIDAQVERTGTLSVATEPHQLAWLDEPRLDDAATRARIDSPLFLGGSHDPSGTLVHPARLALGIARAAAEAGVQILEHSPVLRLDAARRGPVELFTPNGVVRARRLALATNVFRPLLARNRLMTVPVYDHVLVTQPLSEEQWSRIGWSGREGLSDLANQFHYARRTADGRILWGGYDAVYHPGGRIRARYEDRPATSRRLASHFLAVFPQLEDVRFSHRWAGAIDTCTRFCAFHGLAHGGRVAYTAGYTGLGVTATRFGAQVMLDLLAGEKTERTELEMVRRRPLPFPPEPVATLGIQATRWSLDRADHQEGHRNPLLRTLDALGLGFDS